MSFYPISSSSRWSDQLKPSGRNWSNCGGRSLLGRRGGNERRRPYGGGGVYGSWSCVSRHSDTPRQVRRAGRSTPGGDRKVTHTQGVVEVLIPLPDATSTLLHCLQIKSWLESHASDQHRLCGNCCVESTPQGRRGKVCEVCVLY